MHISRGMRAIYDRLNEQYLNHDLCKVTDILALTDSYAIHTPSVTAPSFWCFNDEISSANEAVPPRQSPNHTKVTRQQ
jgi:hypothetical protein